MVSYHMVETLFIYTIDTQMNYILNAIPFTISGNLYLHVFGNCWHYLKSISEIWRQRAGQLTLKNKEKKHSPLDIKLKRDELF